MQDTLIIDTSNAHCGPGSLPGLRLSEGRYSHRSEEIFPMYLLRGWRLAGRASAPSSSQRQTASPYFFLPTRYPVTPNPSHPDPRDGAVAARLPVVSSTLAARGARSGGRGEDGCCVRAGAKSEPRVGKRGVEGQTIIIIFLPLLRTRPQIRRDDPLNLSILLSGGKETNQDSLSSGERRGKSPAPNPPSPRGRGEMWRTEVRIARRGPGA